MDRDAEALRRAAGDRQLGLQPLLARLPILLQRHRLSAAAAGDAAGHRAVGRRPARLGRRPFTDTMLAVDAVGNWCSETVPYAAEGDRPIQPNIIAHGHNGNCGELQDLLCAAARTCLIPALCTMDALEDHVWCEMWLDEWHEYQIDLGRGPTHIDNPGCAYDYDHGGSKDCSCIWDWRGDGWSWQSIGTYSQTCTLSVHIEDPDGVAVDNATVTIASEGYYPPYTIGAGLTGETGQDGTIDFVLGNHQNYYVRVTSGLGNYPPSGYASVITNSTAGEHYYWEWGLTSTMPQLAMVPGAPGRRRPTCSRSSTRCRTI